MIQNEEKIENLWNWFFLNESRIRKAIENELTEEQVLISDHLNNLVLDLGMFTWDIGLDEDNNWFFTISPNGDEELLECSKEIMSYAPDLGHWSFNHCKPSKTWDRIIAVYDSNMDIQRIDTSCWHYIALQDDTGLIELTIEAQNVEHLDEDTLDKIADIFVVNEIGEENKIVHFSNLQLTRQMEDEYSDSKISATKFKNHIESILPF